MRGSGKVRIMREIGPSPACPIKSHAPPPASPNCERFLCALIRPSMTISHSSHMMASAVRALAMDAVQAANSGHPGAPMGMADMAVALWGEHLQHNPVNPHWLNRDRFVLSNGHGSMLIYALLHLTGYKLPMDELKNFRQLHSKTAGHPEVGVTPGVETTTGPLGQGISNAWAWRWPRSSWPVNSTATATPSLTTTPMCSWATAA